MTNEELEARVADLENDNDNMDTLLSLLTQIMAERESWRGGYENLTRSVESLTIEREELKAQLEDASRVKNVFFESAREKRMVGGSSTHERLNLALAREVRYRQLLGIRSGDGEDSPLVSEAISLLKGRESGLQGDIMEFVRLALEPAYSSDVSEKGCGRLQMKTKLDTVWFKSLVEYAKRVKETHQP
jgi:hypothetical protein